MKQYTSEAAKSLITIIGTEYAMGQTRVERGYISQDRMLGTVLERLNRLSVENINLREFLDHGGFIAISEDESEDVHWAKDPMHKVDAFEDAHPKYEKNKTMGARFGNRTNVLTRGVASG